MDKSSKIRVLLIAGAMCAFVVPQAVVAQASDANEKAYHELLQQIDDKKLSIGQKEVFVSTLASRIDSLNAQIDGLDDVTKTIAPMVDKMVVAIDSEIRADFPFKRDERLARLGKLQELVADEGASIGEKYRSALNIYKMEVNYGQGLEAYKGNDPKSPTLRQGDDRYKKDAEGNVEYDKKTGLPTELFDGDYLRYGRAAFVYIDNENTTPMRFDLEAGDWVSLKGSVAADVRRAVRISYGEVAPGVVMAPVFTMP